MTAEEKDGEPGGGDEGNSIRVIIRVRPASTEGGPLEIEGNSAQCVDIDASHNCIRMQAQKDPKTFTFDQVCDIKTTQETVFRSVGKSIIDSCLKGFNGTIFAYGQTGSGKTFTMLGPAENAENFQHELRGVIPRSFEYLFGMIKSQQDMHGDKIQFLCKCSFLEIYMENVYDLLDVAGARGLSLREKMDKGVYVDGLMEKPVTSASHAYQVLTSGWNNRTVASTSMNRESSRSHAVFTVFIESKKLDNGVWNVRSSQLNLVDLAGSERQKDTHTTGARLKEAGNINKSLSTLGNVITALVDISQGKSRHVPYRDSKLTFLLRDSLGGNAQTSVIACIHPGSRCFGETLSTLQFAKRAKMIKNKAVVNADTQGSIVHLQAEIRRLKEQLEACGRPSEPSLTPAVGGDGELGSEEASKYQQYFLHAWIIKQCLQQDNKRLHDVVNAKEKALYQKNMVIKFRDHNIKKLEKALKESSLANEDTVVIIENFERTIEALQKNYDHHPDVLKYRMEAENVMMELKRIRQPPHITQELTSQLEAEFKQMQQLQAKQDSSVTPSSQCRNQEASNATLNRQKAQITKLQEELNQEKQSKAELQASTEKETLKLQSEVESLTATIGELKKINASTRTRYQVEREARDDTIKKISTPKRYNLRSRSGTDHDGSFQDRSFSLGENNESEEGIMSEEAPAVLVADQIENLQEENKRLQEEYRSLSEAVNNKDDEMVAMLQEKTMLASQKKQLEELLCKKQDQYEEERKELKVKNDKLNETLTVLQREYDFTKSEADDLKIMFTQGDKKSGEAIKELKDQLASKEKEAGQLQSQAHALVVRLEQQEEEMNSVKVECEKLQENEETLTATLDYTQAQLANADAAATLHKQEIAHKEAEIVSLSSKQDELKERMQELMEQLKSQEGELQQQLVALQLKVQDRDVELEQEKRMVKELDSSCVALKTTLKEQETQIEALTKTEAELREGVQRSVQELMLSREACELKGREVEEAHATMEELYAAEEELKQQLMATQNDNDKLKEDIQKMDNVLQQEKLKNEDLSAEIDNYCEMQESHLETQLALSAQSAENQIQAQKLKELKQHEEALEKEKRTADETVEKQKEELSSLHSQHEALSSKYTVLQQSEQQLQEKYSTLKDNWMTLKDAISQDRVKLEEVQQSEAKHHESEARSHEAELEKLQEEVSRRDLAHAQLMEEHQRTSEELEKTTGWMARTQASYDQIQEVYAKLKEEQEEIKAKYAASQEEVRELAAYKQQVQDITDQLNAHKALLTDKSHEIELQSREIEEAEAIAQKATTELGKQQEEMELLRNCAANFDKEKEELEQEKTRLQCLLSSKDTEMSELQSSLQNVQEQLTAAQKDVASLHHYKDKYSEVSDENARLVGHQNPKQKINYHVKIKEENNSLREKLANLEKELAISKLKSSTPSKLHHRGGGVTPGVTPAGSNAGTPQKEMPPPPALALMKEMHPPPVMKEMPPPPPVAAMKENLAAVIKENFSAITKENLPPPAGAIKENLPPPSLGTKEKLLPPPLGAIKQNLPPPSAPIDIPCKPDNISQVQTPLKEIQASSGMNYATPLAEHPLNELHHQQAGAQTPRPPPLTPLKDDAPPPL